MYSEINNKGYKKHPDNDPNKKKPSKVVPKRMIHTGEWKYIFTYKLTDQLYRADSEEVYDNDNLAAKHPEVVKKLKRCILAGWTTDGYLGVVDNDQNLEEMLGNMSFKADIKTDKKS